MVHDVLEDTKAILLPRRAAVDLVVEQVPTYVTFECSECGYENSISYEGFCEEHGEPCDGSCDIVKCCNCGKEYEVEDWEFT